MAHTVKVVGTETDRIVEEVNRLLTDKQEYDSMARAVNPYGDGRASERITASLLHYFGFTDVRSGRFPALRLYLEGLLMPYLKYVNVGIMLVMPAIICLFIGSFLDGIFKTGDNITVILLVLGILTGLYSAFKTLNHLDQE